jgi:GNAT superfamily N-acetyltransferase
MEPGAMSDAVFEFKPVTVRFGGTACRVRLLQAGDEARLQAFFKSHTPETIQDRYGFQISEMSAERAAELVNVDQSRDFALGVFARTAGGEMIHAVGRYCLEPAGQGAEVAFVVRESMRGRGIATALLRILTSTARRRGLRTLWGQVNPDNGAMLNIFRRNKFTLSPDPLTGAIRASLVLGGPERNLRRSLPGGSAPR